MSADPTPEPSDPDVSDVSDPDLGDRAVRERSELLPEEQAAGSADPLAQAEAILAESRERTEHPDPDASSQSGRRRSDETA